MEMQRHSTYLASHQLYLQYGNPEEISILFQMIALDQYYYMSLMAEEIYRTDISESKFCL